MKNDDGMKTAVIGSRSLTCLNIDSYVPQEVTCIISGGARGVDTLAEDYARRHGLPFVCFLPDYERYGHRAPLVRNRQIVDSADTVVALWDGRSRGTMYTVAYAKKTGKKVFLYKIKK